MKQVPSPGLSAAAVVPEKFHSIDAVRGIAALSVVVYHWQHMYDLPGGSIATRLDFTARPLYWLLFPLYRGGWIAVDFFFTISGFIFFWMYQSKIRDRSIGAKTFSVLRLSRLYPLHIATLLFVAAMQHGIAKAGHPPFIYAANDAKHFVLNLFFAQTWRFENVHSFNGPSWSVSIEVFLYALFFLFLKVSPRVSPLAIVLISLLGIPFMAVDTKMGIGVTCFFAGGWVWHAWESAKASARARLLTRLAAGIAALGWIAGVIEIRWGAFTSIVSIASTHLSPPYSTWLEHQSSDVVLTVMRIIVLPLTIFALVMHETGGCAFYRRVSRIGDITFASYLLHFPIQISIAAAVIATGASASWFQSGFGMIAFFAILIAVSFACFRWFERPTQRMLRAFFLR